MDTLNINGKVSICWVCGKNLVNKKGGGHIFDLIVIDGVGLPVHKICKKNFKDSAVEKEIAKSDVKRALSGRRR